MTGLPRKRIEFTGKEIYCFEGQFLFCFKFFNRFMLIEFCLVFMFDFFCVFASAGEIRPSNYNSVMVAADSSFKNGESEVTIVTDDDDDQRVIHDSTNL